MNSEADKTYKLNLHFECNNMCSFCCVDKNISGEPIEIIMEKIASFADKGGESLIISGGEPLIFKKIINLISFAKSKGIRNFGIQTNGRMLYYKDFVKELRNFGSINFLVSFHFPNRKLYKEYCGSDGFNETVEGIKNLADHKISFSTNTVIMRPNLFHLQENIDLLKDLGTKKMEFYFISGKNIADKYEKFVPRYYECLPIMKKIMKENIDSDIVLKGFPVCVMEEKIVKKSLNHYITPERAKTDIKQVPAFEYLFPNCEGCIYRSSRLGSSPKRKIGNAGCCPGVKKDYVDFYGIDEFNPITEIQE